MIKVTTNTIKCSNFYHVEILQVLYRGSHYDRKKRWKEFEIRWQYRKRVPKEFETQNFQKSIYRKVYSFLITWHNNCLC